MRASGYYPSPIHGVSTMPSSTVLYGYARIQENMRSDPIEKCKRRPPLMWEGVLVEEGLATMKRHIFTRNGKEYTIIVTPDGVVKGFIDSVLQTTVGSLVPYIQTGEDSDIDMVTVNDTTFVLNRSKIVKLLPNTDATDGSIKTYSYINILTALNYGEDITIEVKKDGYSVGTVTHEVPNLGTTSPDYDAADAARATSAVALSLYTSLLAKTVAWGISVSHKSSCVGVKTSNDAILTLEITTGQGTTSAVAINSTVEKTTGFPLYAIVDSHITVKPDPNKDSGTYYLKAVRIAETVSVGMEEVVWSESRASNEPFALDSSTMPYTISFGDGNVTVGPPEVGWNERTTGDNTSVKVPKFVGSYIKRLGYMQTRLMVLTGSNNVTTKVDDIYDFWKASSIKLLVTDPVSMSSNATDIDVLEHLIPHNKSMLVSGANAQFKVSGETSLDPNTSSMPLVTSIEVDTTSKPVSMGNSVFFATKQGKNSGLIEYTGQKNTTQDKGLSITDHITGLLKGTIVKIVANSNNEMLVVQTNGGNSNEVFVYEQFTNSKGEKKQKSWSKWIFPSTLDILDIHLEYNKLSLLSLENGKLVQHAIYIDSKIAIEKDSTIFLDNKLEVESDGLSYDLPDDYAFDTELIVVRGEDCLYPLYQASFTYDSYYHRINFDNSISDGDTCTIHIGRVQQGRYQPNRPYRRGEDGRVLTEEKIRIANIYVEVSDSYEMGIEVESDYYDANRLVFTNERVGTAVMGVKTPFSGAHDFAFMKDADLANVIITTEGYLGLTITGLRWRGQYTKVTTIV